MAGLGARGKQQVAVVSSTQPAIKTSCQAQECHSSMCSPSFVNFTETPFCYYFLIVCYHEYFLFLLTLFAPAHLSVCKERGRGHICPPMYF